VNKINQQSIQSVGTDQLTLSRFNYLYATNIYSTYQQQLTTINARISNAHYTNKGSETIHRHCKEAVPLQCSLHLSSYQRRPHSISVWPDSLCLYHWCASI